MEPLRDIRISRLLILLELADRPGSLAPVASALDVSVQAVSAHVKRLEKEGLVIASRGGYALTAKGFQELATGLGRLRAFVVEAMSRVTVVRMTEAIAAGRIEKGDAVGLFMEGGLLVARAGKSSSSTGVAEHDAHTGDVLRVSDLSGVVDHAPGRIVFARLSPGKSGAKLEALLKERSAAKVGVLDLAAKAAVGRVGRGVDFEFAVVSAAIHACQRGLDVVLVGGEDAVADSVRALEEANAQSSYRLAHETRSV